jgi:hypothetical protein
VVVDPQVELLTETRDPLQTQSPTA